MLKVTGFEPITDLGNNKKGLKNAGRSISRANITGEDFSNGLLVMVKFTAKQNPSANSRYWEGLLSQNDNGVGFRADLECMFGSPPGNADAKVGNNAAVPPVGSGEGGGEGDDVTVTVGGSPIYIPPAGTIIMG